jgi:iron complex transport system substrate-binding protein
MNAKFVKIIGILTILAVIVVGTLVAGCTSSPTVTVTATPTPSQAPATPSTVTITDDAGRVVTVPFPVSRIATPVIVNEWVMLMLGAENKEVAVANNVPTDPSLLAYYPGYANLSAPFTGWSASGVNMETLLAANPQVVVMDPTDPRISQINGSIPVIESSYSTNMSGYVATIGKLFGGNAQKTADAYDSWYSGMLSNVSAKINSVPQSQRPTFIRIVIWEGQWYVEPYDPTSYYSIGGGVNVVPANASSSLTEEQVLSYAKNVSVIFTNSPTDVQQIMSDPAWQNVPAVKNNQIYIEPSGMSAYGSETPEAALAIVWAANTFYPNLFNGTDMSTISQMNYFYPTFYHYNINATEINDTLSGQGFVPIASEITNG